MRASPPAFDSKDSRALEQFTEEVQEIYGQLLETVAVVGEAASSSYRPGRTPLETVIVVKELRPALLRAARDSLRAWERKRIATPLFLDPAYVEGALDTFPLEFLEMAEYHVILHGGSDFLDVARVERGPLRLQIEEQLRGKLLHLWEHYLVTGGRRRRLERLILDSLPGFEMPLRGLLWLQRTGGIGGASTRDPSERPAGGDLIDAVAKSLSHPLPTMARLEEIRLAGNKIPEKDLDPIFEAYLAEIRIVIDRIDQLQW